MTASLSVRASLLSVTLLAVLLLAWQVAVSGKRPAQCSSTGFHAACSAPHGARGTGQVAAGAEHGIKA